MNKVQTSHIHSQTWLLIIFPTLGLMFHVYSWLIQVILDFWTVQLGISNRLILLYIIESIELEQIHDLGEITKWRNWQINQSKAKITYFPQSYCKVNFETVHSKWIFQRLFVSPFLFLFFYLTLAGCENISPFLQLSVEFDG